MVINIEEVRCNPYAPEILCAFRVYGKRIKYVTSRVGKKRVAHAARSNTSAVLTLFPPGAKSRIR